MFRAVSNGYLIKIYERGWVGLYREPIRPLKKVEVKRYFRSPKVADQLFSVRFTGKVFKDDFNYVPPDKLVKRMKTQLDSDIVYEFIKS